MSDRSCTGRSRPDLVGAAVATDEQAETLEITSQLVALLIGYNSVFDAEGTVIEYSEYITHGDRCTYQRPRE